MVKNAGMVTCPNCGKLQDFKRGSDLPGRVSG